MFKLKFSTKIRIHFNVQAAGIGSAVKIDNSIFVFGENTADIQRVDMQDDEIQTVEVIGQSPTSNRDPLLVEVNAGFCV